MEPTPVHSPPSDPHIDITLQSHDEQNRKLVAQPPSDANAIGNPADSVRIDRAPRAQSTEREVLRQPWPAE
jgi:hypothetical protein